jgi:hypothetical protein
MNDMNYKNMADRLMAFRQAQVPGGGQRPMTRVGAFGASPAASPMGSALMPGSQQGFQQPQWWQAVMGGGLADKFEGGSGRFNAAGRWSRNK